MSDDDICPRCGWPPRQCWCSSPAFGLKDSLPKETRMWTVTSVAEYPNNPDMPDDGLSSLFECQTEEGPEILCGRMSDGRAVVHVQAPGHTQRIDDDVARAFVEEIEKFWANKPG